MGHYVYKIKQVLLQHSLNTMVTPPHWETVYDHRKAVLQLSIIYKVSEMYSTESVVFRNIENGRTCVETPSAVAVVTHVFTSCQNVSDNARYNSRTNASTSSCKVTSYIVLSQCFSTFLSAATPFMPMALTCDPQSQKYTKVNFIIEKAMKIQRAERTYTSTPALNSGLDGGGGLVNATPRSLDPRERRSTHCIGGWVESRTGLGGWAKSCPHRVSISGPSTP